MERVEQDRSRAESAGMGTRDDRDQADGAKSKATEAQMQASSRAILTSRAQPEYRPLEAISIGRGGRRRVRSTGRSCATKSGPKSPGRLFTSRARRPAVSTWYGSRQWKRWEPSMEPWRRATVPQCLIATPVLWKNRSYGSRQWKAARRQVEDGRGT
jgi:hypothetical protein